MKRLFSLILCVCFLTVTTIVPVFAVESGVDDGALPVSIINFEEGTDDKIIESDDIFKDNVKLVLASSTCNSGGALSLNVVAEQNAGFSGAVIRVKFNNAVFSYTGVTAADEGISANVTADGGYLIVNIYSNLKNEQGNTVDYDGKGTVLTINFSVKRVSGEYQFAFDETSQVFNSLGAVISASLEDGKVTVVCNHSFSGYTTIKEADCEEEGLRYRECTCGYRETSVIAPLGHTTGTWKTYKPADCDEGGIEGYFCNRCDKVLETRTTEAIGHVMGWVVTKKPTCTEEGVKTYLCIICGGEQGQTQSIPVVSHEPGAERVAVKPTCSSEGVKEIVCKNCPHVISTAPIEKIPHGDKKLVVLEAPTADKEGSGEYRCIECNDIVKTVTLEKVKGIIHGKEDQVSAYVGDTVRIPVIIDYNSGFSYGVVRISYNSEYFEFMGIEAGIITNDITVGTPANGEIRVLICPEDATSRNSGTLFYMEFKVKENAETDLINIYYDPQNDFSDKNGDRVFFNFKGVDLKVKRCELGDVDDDKKVDTTDLAKMKLFLVGAVTEIGDGADVNEDGKVDTTDLALLKLYLAGAISSFE